MKITVAMLKEAGACKPQVEEFERRFPDGVEVSVEAAVAVADIFNWDWAAENLLPRSAREACDAAVESARQACEAAVESAWQACDAAVVPAQQAYNAAVESAWQAYDAAVESAWQAYNAAAESARQAYNAGRAEAFARCALEAGEWR